ncbi:hypothetical protein COCON_G00191890 [Conger conger]|uniref:Uncharacterized protein n=1 Tax=Conger conger TaxID=82655 RepID=A0A9Q1D3Y8_CONCO|nr:hypothetical protein COCON_G00191890 [Conger conger]
MFWKVMWRNGGIKPVTGDARGWGNRWGNGEGLESRAAIFTSLGAAGLSASFGAMLLMVAARFHDNEVSTIIDSVSSARSA